MQLTESQKALWERIDHFQIDDTEADFCFSDRLARENNWSLEFSLRTIDEYKRFMFLICVANHPLTPSDQVDQVWHLHLLYTQSYWESFCSDVLQRSVHHGPTKGGSSEKVKFHDWYNQTKKLYNDVFQISPPKDIWPSSQKRFESVHFTRVNRDDFWIVPKLRFLKK